MFRLNKAWTVGANVRRCVFLGSDGVDAPSDGIDVPRWRGLATEEEAPMSKVSTIGLDLAKNVFQVHGADVAGAVFFGNDCAAD
jgi:hypothetical protein